VTEVGPGVAGVAIGDAVFGFGNATMAEEAILTHWARKPDAVLFEIAAGLPVISDTATRALDQVGIKKGQTLLVSGAAGGVGTAMLQLAGLRGITVIGTASAGKHDYLAGLGAIPTTYGDGLAERVGLLAPSGVDAAIDVAGSGIIPELIGIRRRRLSRPVGRRLLGRAIWREVLTWTARRSCAPDRHDGAALRKRRVHATH